jgi:hypothetical protein
MSSVGFGVMPGDFIGIPTDAMGTAGLLVGLGIKLRRFKTLRDILIQTVTINLTTASGGNFYGIGICTLDGVTLVRWNGIDAGGAVGARQGSLPVAFLLRAGVYLCGIGADGGTPQLAQGEASGTIAASVATKLTLLGKGGSGSVAVGGIFPVNVAPLVVPTSNNVTFPSVFLT